MYQLINNESHLSLGQSIKAMLSAAALQLLGLDMAAAVKIADTWQVNSDAQVIKVLDYSALPIVPTAQSPIIEVVEANDPDWREIITSMIHTGKASPAELIQFALQQSDRAAPGKKMPPWIEIDTICLDYERNKHKYRTQEHFARKHGMSAATFKRYWRLWKSAGKSI